MPYAIIRIAKLKKSNIGGSGSHVARSRATPNADRSKLSANQTLIHHADRHLPMSEVVAAKIAASQQKRKIRPDAVHAVEFLLTASPEYFRPDDPTAYGGYDRARLEQWKMATVQWLEREYGDKIVRAELHLDEATPHVHAFLVPIDEKGQLNCRDFFGQRKKMFALQDSYAQAMKPLGLERGQRESRATHTSVKKYYSVVNEFCDGGVDSVIANLKSENAQLTAKLRESVAEVDELQVERDELRKQLELKAEMSLQITLPEVEKFGELTSQSAADTQKYYPTRAELLQWWETSTGDTSVEIDALGQRLKSKYEDENPSPATMPNDYKSDNVWISIADKERFNRASEPQQLSAAEHIAQQREKNRIEMTRNRSDERPRSRGR